MRQVRLYHTTVARWKYHSGLFNLRLYQKTSVLQTRFEGDVEI